jgi:outer membrane receptor protein involved in Fe transport
VGARGTWKDLHDWELSYTYSEYKYKSSQPWFKYQDVIDTMLGVYLGPGFFGDPWWSAGTLGEPLDFPLGGAGTFAEVNPSVLNAISQQTYGNKSTDHFLSFTMTGDLMEMRAGPLSYAMVLEYEDSDFKYIPDALLLQSSPTTDAFGDPITQNLKSSGWYKLTGYDGGGDRQRWATGAELRVPVTQNLILNLAARYDDYDSGSTSFGGDLTPSASLEYRPLSNLLLRAGYTESFRAPDLALVFVDTGFFQQGLDLVSCWEQYNFQNPGGELTAAEFNASGLIASECEVSSEFVRRTGAQNFGEGEKPLDAETGNSWWVGFSWDFTDNLTVQADYVHMELEDRAVTSIVNDLLDDEWECLLGNLPQANCDANAQRVQRKTDPTTGLTYIDNIYVSPFNSSLLEADSLDARVTYQINTRAGLFGFTGDYSLIVNLDEREIKGGEKVNLRDDPRAGGWDFRSSFIGTLSHSYADYAQTWTVIYRGGTTTWNRYSVIDGRDMWDDPGTAERVDAWVVWNWTGQYSFTDDLLGRIRVLNVFDEGPPKDETFEWFTDPWFNYYVYSGAAIGRQIYAELQLTF